MTTTVSGNQNNDRAREIRRALSDELNGVERRTLERISGLFDDIVCDYFGPHPTAVARGIRDGLLAQFERNFNPHEGVARVMSEVFFDDYGVEVRMFAMVCQVCGVHDDWSSYYEHADGVARTHNLSLHADSPHGEPMMPIAKTRRSAAS
jgi:hypothetical protein